MKCSLLLFCLLVLVACQKNQGNDLQSAHIIQNGDDRTQISAADEKLKKTASAIATIIQKKRVIDNKDGTFTIRAFAIEEDLCPEERFKDALRFGKCTAFKISDNAIATAGHCLQTETSVKDFCQEYLMVFNFNDLNVKQGVQADVTVKESQVVSCEDILFYSSANADDVAIVSAKMSSDIPSLKISDRALKVKDEVVKVGHGYGYLSNSSFGKVTEVDELYRIRSTNDVFGGDSGSPLLDAKTHEVVGVMVRATDSRVEDRIYDPFRSCYKDPKTQNVQTGFASSMKSNTILLPAVKSIIFEDLVQKALHEPTVENLENLKKEVDPNLHFSVFTGTSSIAFMNAVFQINNFSIPLLNEISELVPEDTRMELLEIGYATDNNEFREAVYDKFFATVADYDYENAARTIVLIPESRLTSFFNKYEDNELIELAIELYNGKKPALVNLIKYRPELLGLNRSIGHKNKSIWASMNVSHEIIYMERLEVDGSDKQIKKLNYDYEILKAHLGITEINDETMESLKKNTSTIAIYFGLIHKWKTEQVAKK